MFVSLLLGIPSESECLCPTLGMSCGWLVVPPPSVSLRRVDRLISGVMMAVVVGIVYEWQIEPHFLRYLSNVCNRPLWWWRCQWTHPPMFMWLWCTLIGGMSLRDGLLNIVYPLLAVSIYVASLDNMCPKIRPGVDRFLDLLPLYWQSYILLVRVWCQRVTARRERLDHLLFLCK